MNSHLNVFKTYAKENRVYQLENDLTRALAICMQEDALFFYEVLKAIINNDKEFELIFSNSDIENKLNIGIQINANSISGFQKIFAVSLSEKEMNLDNFFNQTNIVVYDPICDIVIELNEILIIIETKRDSVDCTAQLYNQAFNILKNSNYNLEFNQIVQPRDLNWRKLMQIGSKVLAFENTVANTNRFTVDFINLVKGHNPNWLPETPIAALHHTNSFAIKRRLDSAFNLLDFEKFCSKLNYADRIGLRFNKPWAQEILFYVNDTGDIYITIYAGNTKAQGLHIFNQSFSIAESLNILNEKYEIDKQYHIKFSSFQKFFTGLDFYDEDLKIFDLYTIDNFHNYTGRNYKEYGNWEQLETLFDKYFKEEFNWKEQCDWCRKITNSGKSQFDLSFGYSFSITIPFERLKEIDNDMNNIVPLADFVKEIYKAFEEDLIK
jgi:hypothetical protein